ncbi:kelch-like protein 28 [Biomphalaria pfeifferi]|uniref:Kelch-like protein 28 n=1 Tax=Biomphalaria pfeifferi TaxID=112525 RepID=A0AAD8F359_BIOPF|nr:kelch-like protein 28 [Biomphalaria pfeifferi]
MSIKREIACGIVQGIGKFWKCEELQDFTVTLGTTKFGCHRFLLAACSGFFRGLFRSWMKETRLKNVILEDISCETFELILESMYIGHGVLTNDNVIDIWRVADKLQIVFLITECEHFVLKSLSLENYNKYYQIGCLLSSQPVTKAAWPYILNNFHSFVQSSAFLESSMNELLKLVQSQELVVNSEHDVIKAILKWTKFNPYELQHDLSDIHEMSCKRLRTLGVNSNGEDNETFSTTAFSQNSYSDNRGQHLGLLLSNARTCLLSRESLEMLLCNPLVSDNKMAIDVVNKALSYKLQIGKRNGQWPTAAIRRNCSNFENVAMATKRKLSGGCLLQAFSLTSNKWLNLDNTDLKDRDFVAFCAMDNVLHYFLAPMDDARLIGYVYIYQLVDKTWKAIKMYLVLKYAKFYVTVINDFIYILPSNGQVMGRLHPASETLVSSPPVPADPTIKVDQPISHVTNYEHMILVFSSVSGKDVETVVQCYDTSQNIWTRLNNLEGPAKGMTSFRDDHFIYILQSNGDLWKIVKPQSDSLEFEYVDGQTKRAETSSNSSPQVKAPVRKTNSMSIKPEAAHGIIHGLSDFWKCSELQDFTVMLGTTKFGCHRFLLAACSGFFRGLFRSGMKETELKYVNFEDIYSETFELILESMYTGHGVLTNDNVIDIWRAADKLQIVFLITECENFVIKSLSLENYIEYYQIGNLLNSQSVTKAAWPYVINNFNSFYETRAFLESPMNEILHIVQSQDLKVNSEQDVIKAILHWTEFKPTRLQHNVSTIREMRCKRFKTLTINKFESNETITISDQSDSKPQNISSDSREQYLGILLSKARLCLVSRESLEMLLCNPLVSDNKMANDVVNKALLYKVQIGKRNGQRPTAVIHRNESDFEDVALTTKRKENGDLLLQTMSFPRNNFLHLDVRCLIGKEFVAVCTMDSILYYFFMAHKENQGHNASVYAYR